MNKNLEALLYYIDCAVNSKTPEFQQGVDYNVVLAVAHRQGVLPYIYETLVGLGVEETKKYSEHMKSGLLQAELQSYYRELVDEALNNEKVNHVFIKGKDMLRFMPENVKRFSCDVDMYYEKKDREKVKKVMLGLGFNFLDADLNHDAFTIDPFITFEMHYFVDYAFDSGIFDFNNLNKVKEYSYEMSDEDVFLMQLFHVYSHFTFSGTSIRSVIDNYLVRKCIGTNSPYILERVQKQNIKQFFKSFLEFEDMLFGNKEKTDMFYLTLKFMLEGNVYGSMKNYSLIKMSGAEGTTEKSLKRQGKLKRMFPNYKYMCLAFPVLKKLPFLLPIMWVWRLFYAVLFKQKRIKQEMDSINSLDKQEIINNQKLLNYYGIK